MVLISMYWISLLLVIPRRAITIVHLLTNTNWGAGQPIRFLSCRQSIPQRDRVSAVGDASMVSAIRSEIGRTRKSISNILLRHQRTKHFIESLRDSKCIIEMRRTGSGISPCVNLLPTVSVSSVCSIASVSFIDDTPTLETDPFLQFFIRNKLELNFSIGKLPSPKDLNPMDVSEAGPQDIVARAQMSALDLAVIRGLQNENPTSCCEEHRIISIRKSSTENDYSIAFCFMGNGLPQPLVISLWMGSTHTGENRSVVQSLRKRILQLSASYRKENSSSTLCRIVCDHIHSLL